MQNIFILNANEPLVDMVTSIFTEYFEESMSLFFPIKKPI